MQNQNEAQNKPKQTISLSNLPSIITAVVFIVGIGAVFGLLGYLVSGIKENVTSTAQKPIAKVADEIIADKYFGNDFIQIELPQKNAVIKSPVLISGKANVDEANVRVKITDGNKNILADTFITADGWMDKLHPFEKEITYQTPQTENGLIEIFEESAKDGSEIYKVEIPVVFEEYEDAFSDWKVYQYEDPGFKRFEIKYPSNAEILELGDVTSIKAAINLPLIKEPYLEKVLYITRFNTSEDECKDTLGFAALEYKGLLKTGEIENIERKDKEINRIKFVQEKWEEDKGYLMMYHENYKTYSKKSFLCYNFIFVIKTKEEFSESDKNKETDIFNKIMSTFKPFRM